MLVLPLLLLLAPALGIPPGPVCPHLCTCTMAEGKVGFQNRRATCQQMPTQKLPSTITSLLVTGQIATITKKMISTLGGDLQVLDLSKCGIRKIDSDSFDGAPKLTTLKLSDNYIENIDAVLFKKVVHLKVLYLDGNKLKNIDEAAFNKLAELRALHLERNYLTRIPSKIPTYLEFLNLSHNNLGPEIATNLHESKLKTLDLCANRIQKLSTTTLSSLKELQTLCLGDMAVPLPDKAHTHLRHLTELKLQAGVGSNAVIDPITQKELKELAKLTLLRLVNYKIDSLQFLQVHSELRTIELLNISTTGSIDFQSFLLSKPHLEILNLEGSPQLAHELLDNMHVLVGMNHLQVLNLRNTHITHLVATDIPQSNILHLDISQNPLICDCRFSWLNNEHTQVGISLQNEEETLCSEPEVSAGLQLKQVINEMDCSTQPNNEDQGYVDINPSEEIPEPNPGFIETTTRRIGEDGDLYQESYTEGSPDHPEEPRETTPNDHNPTLTPTETDQAQYPSDEHTQQESHSMSHEDMDDYNTLYIILGCLLAILVIAGIILSVFYWQFKKGRENKVTPGPHETPKEPSFKHLQHTEDTSLLKNVKK